jgi:hypothetical protein
VWDASSTPKGLAAGCRSMRPNATAAKHTAVMAAESLARSPEPDIPCQSLLPTS